MWLFCLVEINATAYVRGALFVIVTQNGDFIFIRLVHGIQSTYNQQAINS